MDDVPSAFVVSLMENLLTIERCPGLKHVVKLGRGYGTIAREVCKAATTCDAVIPGILFEAPFNGDRVFVKAPTFKGLLEHTRRPPSVKTLVELSLTAEYLAPEGNYSLTKGTSMREIRRLIRQCRHVRVRELVVKRFPSSPLPWGAFFPGLTTFFNRVVLHYHETDSFQEFLLAFVEGEKLEMLWLRDDYRFPRSVPRWLQETILNVFFQPQFQHLKLPFYGSCWASSVLFNSLLRHWLMGAETFPETTKVLDICGAPPIAHLRGCRVESTGARFLPPILPGETYQDYVPCARRRFLLPHPESVERMLEVTVSIRTNPTFRTMTISDEAFFEKACFSKIKFHFKRGDNAIYWRAPHRHHTDLA
uniref:F-box domain-containing protein n=1 Tax=Steinernema glaseri TaxID=37863 RepID=A0A1I7YVS6_9BILA